MNTIEIFNKIFESIENPKIEIIEDDYMYYSFNGYLTSTINADNIFYKKFKDDLDEKTKHFFSEFAEKINSSNKFNVRVYLTKLDYLKTLIVYAEENFIHLNIEYIKVNDLDEVIKIPNEVFSYFLEIQNEVLKNLKKGIINLIETPVIPKTESIIINSNLLEIYGQLKDYFDIQHHSSLKKLLSGKNIESPIIFNSNASILIDVFKRLKRHNLITQENTDIANWIYVNFRYRAKPTLKVKNRAYSTILRGLQDKSGDRSKQIIPYFKNTYPIEYNL